MLCGSSRNAFLSASDIVPEEDDEGNGHRHHHANVPPINQLIHNNQEILVQVARAPMGTKGARITTRLSLPGRYMVLMLNSGSYIGVSRKIEDDKERQRLKKILARLPIPQGIGLIVRTAGEDASQRSFVRDARGLIEIF